MKYPERTHFIAALVVLSSVTMISCSKDNGGKDNSAGICDGVTSKSYSANVDPIIQTYCNKSGCHNSGSANGPGPLTNYTEVFNARTLVRSAVSSGSMPKDVTLTTAQKNTIICWIDSGAPNN